MAWYWLSFSIDGEFVGVVITQGDRVADAVMSAHERGLNPGGECSYFRIPPKFMPAPQYRERLLSYSELVSAGLLE